MLADMMQVAIKAVLYRMIIPPPETKDQICPSGSLVLPRLVSLAKMRNAAADQKRAKST
jgi:hypothetical protein